MFDSKFAQTLSDARKRSGAFPTAAPDLQPADSFVGGQRRSFLQIGKLCFEEIDADPLDSFSQQQWYPRSCD
ncbi:hypothetical protein NOR53_1407 [gamma proteobacterium NOR5-3]|nr:hypothetical protein NOR53_1407 [gamma proteobacterium NOR5-3]